MVGDEEGRQRESSFHFECRLWVVLRSLSKYFSIISLLLISILGDCIISRTKFGEENSSRPHFRSYAS
jgi:hypothetical protein